MHWKLAAEIREWFSKNVKMRMKAKGIKFARTPLLGRLYVLPSTLMVLGAVMQLPYAMSLMVNKGCNASTVAWTDAIGNGQVTWTEAYGGVRGLLYIFDPPPKPKPKKPPDPTHDGEGKEATKAKAQSRAGTWL